MSLRPRDAAAMRRLLGRAEASASTPWEDQFVSDIATRFEEEGDGLQLSERQWEKLWEIAEEQL